MSQLLHLRLGRFSGQRPFGRRDGRASVVETPARLDEMANRACQAMEWRSATEAWLDLGTGRGSQSPWAIADQLRAATRALLPVEVSCGVAATKSAARAASALAAPSGLLVVLSGYESSIEQLAQRSAGTDIPWPAAVDAAIDAAPFRPSLVPRAIVRSMVFDRDPAADADAIALALRIDDAIAQLVSDARIGMADLGVIAATVRVQFANRGGVREAFASLPDATSLESAILDTAQTLGRRVLQQSSGAGHLLVSLGQLVAGPAQASLFGWRYDHAGAPARRRFA